jgi:hypothetical protein
MNEYNKKIVKFEEFIIEYRLSVESGRDKRFCLDSILEVYQREISRFCRK